MRQLILLLMLIFFIMAFVTPINAQAAEAGRDNDERSVYKVGVNDVIEIKVLDHNEFHSLSSVASDGSIILPYIGAVFVKDKTLKDIEEEITKKLSEGYLKYPVVSVSLVKSLSKAVFLYGEVGRPGMYPIEENMTTVLRILSVAGGITNDGLHGDITLRRKQKNSSNYKEIYLGSKEDIEKTEKGNMILMPNDILIVERNKTFLIEGEVIRRGRYALEKGMTVINAIINAGGVTAEGLHGSLKVRRKTNGELGGYKTIAESGIKNGILIDNKVEDTVLSPDDILLVERNQTFLTQGEVLKRGKYALEKNMTVLRALLEAGGVTDDGRYGKVKLRRKKEGKSGEYRDIVESKLINGVIADRAVEDTVLQADDILFVDRNDTFFMYGEFGKTGQFVLEQGMTVTRAISLAGGVRPDGLYGDMKIRRKQEADPGYLEIKVDLTGSGKDDVSGDIKLMPDDILIAGRNNTYFIYGEINRPGEYVLKQDITVFEAITIGGGFTKWGSKSRVKILRTQSDKSGLEIIKVDIGDIIDGDLNSDIKLQPGDVVVASSGSF